MSYENTAWKLVDGQWTYTGDMPAGHTQESLRALNGFDNPASGGLMGGNLGFGGVDPAHQYDYLNGSNLGPAPGTGTRDIHGASRATNWVGTDGQYYGPPGTQTMAGWNGYGYDTAGATGTTGTTGGGSGSGGETAGYNGGGGFQTYTGAPSNTTGWQTKGGYNFDTMPQSQKDYVGQFINGLMNEDPAKAKQDYLNAQRDFGFSDDLFSKFTSMYGNKGFTGEQISAWKGPAPAPPPAGPTTQPTAQPSRMDTYLDNRMGAGAPALQGYQKNPYLDDMAMGLTRQANDNWTRNIDPSIRSGAMAAGGFGGSRQGVVEANALNDWSKNLGDSLTNLYGNDYQQSMSRNLQKYLGDQQYDLGLGNLALGNQNSLQNYTLGLGNLDLGYRNANNNYDLGLRNNALGYYNGANSYDLGLRNNDLGYANLDAQISQNNFNNRLAGANFGMNAWQAGQASNNNATNIATLLQNMPMQYWLQFMNAANSAGGLGGTTTGESNTSGNWASGALSGLQTGANILNLKGRTG